MNTWLLRFVMGGALAALTSVHAADAPTDRGWYLEANALNVQSSGETSQFTLDGEEQGWALGAGYAFNKHLAVAASFHRFGEHFATDCLAEICTAVPHEDLVDLEGISVAAIGTWQVAPNVELFGKLGVIDWDADFERQGFDDSGRDPIYGAGVGVRLTPQWRLNVQYEQVDFDLESAGIGASYRF